MKPNENNASAMCIILDDFFLQSLNNERDSLSTKTNHLHTPPKTLLLNFPQFCIYPILI